MGLSFSKMLASVYLRVRSGSDVSTPDIYLTERRSGTDYF